MLSKNPIFASWPVPRKERAPPAFRVSYDAERARSLLLRGKALIPPEVSIVDMARKMVEMGMVRSSAGIVRNELR